MSRQEERKAESKARILAAAVEVLSSHQGDESRLRLADVAARAGVSQALISVHFGNRSGLLEEVNRRSGPVPRRRKKTNFAAGPASGNATIDLPPLPPPDFALKATPAWIARLRSECERLDIDLPSLGDHLTRKRGSDAVRAWLTGPAHLPLDVLLDLQQLLGYPLAAQLSDLGLLEVDAWDPSIASRAFEGTIQRLATDLEALTRDRTGLGSFLARLAERGGWEIQVEPVFEGPEQYKVHTFNRIALTPSSTRSSARQREPEPLDSLVKLRSPQDFERMIKRLDTRQPPTSQSVAVPCLGRTFPSADPSIDAPSDIVVVSFDAGVGATEVADLIAWAIGYASNSTARRADQLFPPFDGAPLSRPVPHDHAIEVLRRHLASPPLSSERFRVVWAHDAEPDEIDVIDVIHQEILSGSRSSKTLFLFVRSSSPPFANLDQDDPVVRQKMDRFNEVVAAVDRLERKHRRCSAVVVVDINDVRNPARKESGSDRNSYIERCFTTARQALGQIERRQDAPSARGIPSVHAECPEPFHRYLRAFPGA